MFKWSCLAAGVVFLSVLTWMVNDVRQGIRDMREDAERARPRATLEGEIVPGMIDGQPSQFITVNYNPPFASPPQLTFPEGHAGWEVTANQADFYNLRRTGSGSEPGSKFRWKAEGRPARSKVEEQNEAILRAFQQLQSELFRQDAQHRHQNEMLLQELRGLRQDAKKWVEGQSKK